MFLSLRENLTHIFFKIILEKVILKKLNWRIYGYNSSLNISI